MNIIQSSNNEEFKLPDVQQLITVELIWGRLILVCTVLNSIVWIRWYVVAFLNDLNVLETASSHQRWRPTAEN